MQSNHMPKMLGVPFAENGVKKDIPDSSQIGIENGRASYNDGFPPLTRIPLSAGGVPPYGTDFNGVFYDVTSKLRWKDAGMGYTFSGTFAAAVSGYPKGATVPSSNFNGKWINTIENNFVAPEGSASSSTGWIPTEFYGSTSVSISSSNVTMSCIDAANPRLILSGALTANRILYVPQWKKEWTIENNCSGPFTVTIRTIISTITSTSTSGSITKIYCDGTNTFTILGTAASRNVGKSAGQIPTMDDYLSGDGPDGAYRVLPNGSQYCRTFTTIPANGTCTWSFPRPFASQPVVFYSVIRPGAPMTQAMWFNGIGPSDCSLFNPNASSCSIDLFAIL
ncbi:hypothetical protein [Serratia liquefaciens]|uniref:hypothetical protein n=1 Tax=Serratia liquefaciens TaxID=614 RepID=UPI00165D2544|nr:hypothetical protein [Serratia liquefaciens]QNQ52552.1 hypothetical protein IAI46_14955 [Serratia liquefaciens]